MKRRTESLNDLLVSLANLTETSRTVFEQLLSTRDRVERANLFQTLDRLDEEALLLRQHVEAFGLGVIGDDPKVK